MYQIVEQTYNIRLLVFIPVSRRGKAAQPVSHAKDMPSNQEVTEYRADDTNPNQHVICVNSNKVPFSVDPTPDLFIDGL
jgi:hypothetical protein